MTKPTTEQAEALPELLREIIEEWVEPHEYERSIGIGCAKADPAFPCDQCLLGDKIRALAATPVTATQIHTACNGGDHRDCDLDAICQSVGGRGEQKDYNQGLLDSLGVIQKHRGKWTKAASFNQVEMMVKEIVALIGTSATTTPTDGREQGVEDNDSGVETTA